MSISSDPFIYLWLDDDDDDDAERFCGRGVGVVFFTLRLLPHVYHLCTQSWEGKRGDENRHQIALPLVIASMCETYTRMARLAGSVIKNRRNDSIKEEDDDDMKGGKRERKRPRHATRLPVSIRLNAYCIIFLDKARKNNTEKKKKKNILREWWWGGFSFVYTFGYRLDLLLESPRQMSL